MLRAAVLIFGVGLLVAGLVMLAMGKCGYFPFLIWGSILVIAIPFERWRYRRQHRDDAQWQPTGEKFEDPETGQIMEVEFDPTTGERRYVKK